MNTTGFSQLADVTRSGLEHDNLNTRCSGRSAAGLLLALMPFVSFGLQFWLSKAVGREMLFLRHYPVAYVDWIFVPFNLLVVRAINWRCGATLYMLVVASATLNCVSHAYWQYELADTPAHMFTRDHVFLLAGWVHVWFSTLEMVLVGAFIFAREISCRLNPVLTSLILLYLLGGGIGGYLINHGFMVTDVAMVAAGSLLVLVYPRFAYNRSASAEAVLGE